MLDEPEVEGQPPKIVGSTMLAHAATREEVLEIMKSDVYAAEVWDFERMQIFPVCFCVWFAFLGGRHWVLVTSMANLLVFFGYSSRLSL